jgi:hypothetical protein
MSARKRLWEIARYGWSIFHTRGDRRIIVGMLLLRCERCVRLAIPSKKLSIAVLTIVDGHVLFDHYVEHRLGASPNTH